MPTPLPKSETDFSARRRLLKVGAYVPPAVLGAMVLNQSNAWASSDGGSKDDKNKDDKSKDSGSNNPSCAPCFCAPCGRSGEKNSKACDDHRSGCQTSSKSKDDKSS